MENLTLTQKNYCSLNNLSSEECVTFWSNHSVVEYSMLSNEQKSICDINNYSNEECLTYWVGKDDGTPVGTKPKKPSYEDLTEGQKEYCTLNNFSDSECVDYFFDKNTYNELTEEQKEYCTLNNLSNSECVFHFINDGKDASEVEQEWLESEKKPEVMYFDDVSYNNSKLKTKNRATSNLCSYVVLNGANLKNHKNYIRQNLGADFEEFTRTEPEFENIAMEQSYQKTAWITLNSRDKKEPPISKILIDIEAPGGIYRTNDDGKFTGASVSVLVEITGWNSSYSTPLRYFYSSTISTKTANNNGISVYFNNIRPSINFSGKGGKSPIRVGYTVNLPSGYYQMRIIRNSKDCFNSTKLNNNFNIKRVVSVFDLNAEYRDITLLAFKLTSNQQFSGTSALKVNCLVRKRSKNPESYVPYQLTLRDFVYDIWTNKKTGLGEDINSLDIRADLQEVCNLCLEESDVAFNVLKDVLAGYGYVIYPNNNTFVIEKDKPKETRSYIFHEGNYKKISFNYSIPQESELGNGIRVKYVPQGQLEMVEYTYPENSDNPREIVLKGVSVSSIAEETAKRMHKKDTLRAKTCIIETDLEGFIPELNSRVAVSSKYLKNTITSTVEKIEHLIEGDKIITKLYLPDNISFKENQKKLNLLNKKMVKLETHSVIPFEGIRNYVLVDSDLDFDLNENFVIIGEEKEFLEDYTVESITPTQDEEGNITSVKLNLIEYNLAVYL